MAHLQSEENICFVKLFRPPGGKHTSLNKTHILISNSDTKRRIQRKDAHLGTEVPFRRAKTFIRCVPVENNFVNAFTKVASRIRVAREDQGTIQEWNGFPSP